MKEHFSVQSAFDVTTNTNSFLLREDEGPLYLIDISLPFIKKSHMWRKFESMEVFQMMPQLPHFHALEKENEELREGLALGHMLSFANLKDKTCKAHIEDSRSMFENKLNALTDLEELGFTVHLIRSRLEELLRMRDRYDQLIDKSKAAEGEILNKKCQFDEIEESITRLNMQQ
ncbi:hypothetical protein AQUCO_02200259v1 [Aquilegia coerulea]|uniref:Uncharacterized protein n=1 Tax=Aquilegia coerulea TaxID=218851 RepID=A0A2G5DDW1_AQUCA|nr:hypothetical protein AQUCO_02200259v1 [Aquilegia coerulea]